MAFPKFTWPDWKSAPEGTRFRHTQTGRTGTVIGPAPCGHNGAIVEWDEQPFGKRPGVDGIPGHVYFVGIARDAVPINPGEES